jgi:hypothetical protein
MHRRQQHHSAVTTFQMQIVLIDPLAFLSYATTDADRSCADSGAFYCKTAGGVTLTNDSAVSQLSRPRYSQSEIRTWVGINIIINIFEYAAL